MRRILAGTLGLAFGLGSSAFAHEPAVTLGAPTVGLGAPRSGSTVQPVSFLESRIARGKIDDKSPLPPGPVLNAAPQPNPLPPPTPMGTPAPIGGGPIVGMPYMNGAVDGPVSSGPVMGSPVVGGPECASCGGGGFGFGQYFAPLPGGVFSAPAACPCPFLIWGRAEYLLWTIRDSNLPVLLVAGPAGSVITSDGNLNGTMPVVGGNSIGDQLRSGFRVNAGFWINECQNWGLDGSYFFLGQKSNSTTVSSNGNPELGRPYFDPVGTPIPPLNGPGTYAEVVAANGIAGTFTATTRNQLWGADLNVRKGLFIGCNWRVDALGGFRYLNFEEDLNINEVSTLIGANPSMQGVLTDNFEVKNQFYGGQLGLVGEIRRGRWSLDWTSKVALGTTQQQVNINGAQTLLIGGVPAAGARAGLLAQGSNSGSFSRNVFSVVPEMGMNVGWQATQHVRLYAGYNFLYWTNVLRVGDQVDTTLNVPSRPGPLLLQRNPANPIRPVVPFQSTDFWAQGLVLGMQVTW